METVYEKLAEMAFDQGVELPVPYFTMRVSRNDGKEGDGTPAWFPGCEEGDAPTVSHYCKRESGDIGAFIHLAAPSF